MAERGRTFRVLGALVRQSVSVELQYPANFLGSALGSVFWLGMALLTVAVFYEHTSNLGGWSFWETVVLLGVFNALVGVIEGLLRPGIGNLSELVRNGHLDLVLVRPVDAQLYVSFHRVDLWRIADVLLGFGLAVYGMAKLGRPVDAGQAFTFALAFSAAVAVIYSLWVILMCTAFWFVAVENAATVFDALFEAARYPASAYPRALRIVFVYLLPVVWCTTTPASALVGRLTVARSMESVVIAGVGLLLSRLLWNAALRRYASTG